MDLATRGEATHNRVLRWSFPPALQKEKENNFWNFFPLEKGNVGHARLAID